MSAKDNNFSFGPVQEDFTDATSRGLPKLTLSDDVPMSEAGRSFNPYDRDLNQPRSEKTVKTDLRKLSEWIKLQKEVEARKAAGLDDTGDHPTPADAPKR